MSRFRVAWCGRTLFDHEPKVAFFEDRAAAGQLIRQIKPDLEGWITCTELHDDERDDLWPPAMGDYPNTHDGLWPWERIGYSEFEPYEGPTTITGPPDTRVSSVPFVVLASPYSQSTEFLVAARLVTPRP